MLPRALAVFFLSSIFAAPLASESVTLTTYYPAPSGVYQQMITTGATYLARDGNSVHVGSLSSPGSMVMNMYAHKIVNGPTAAGEFSSPGDYVTKAYVDAASGGPTDWTCAVRQSAAALASSSILCVIPEKVVAGGCVNAGGSLANVFGHPLDQGWRCASPGNTVQAWANCCR
ncbi:MAG: hypothetical protein HY403_09015 [Elusimicrobia bacterium]|nr:hypothetical protein [Elusimicrobiota bacterium]